MAYTEANTLELTREELGGVFGGELTELRQQHLCAHMRLAKAMGIPWKPIWNGPKPVQSKKK